MSVFRIIDSDGGDRYVHEDHIFDVMIVAQKELGQITWVELNEDFVKGEFGPQKAIGNRNRLAIVYADFGHDYVLDGLFDSLHEWIDQ